MANSLVYQEDWETKLQERLSEPTKWKDICNVVYTNEKVLHNPYMSDMTVQTNTRGTAYTFQNVTQTDDTISIVQSAIAPQFIDRADLAQSQYTNQMTLADRQGILLNEQIEAAVYADNANFTDIGDPGTGVITLNVTSTITVSATNVDDIIRGVKREIRKADGETLLERNGGFFVWRPQDLEVLESFMQANGFMSADRALNGGSPLDGGGTLGAPKGIEYMGMTHYSSNLLAANHVFAGVKKLYHLGIVKDTYGQVVVTTDPPGPTGGALSGFGIVSRVDYQGHVWHNVKPVLFDVNVT